MHLFIRLMCFSFPFVFAGALFWPMLEHRFFPPEPPVQQVFQVPVLPVSKPAVQRSLPRPQAETAQPQPRQSVSRQQSPPSSGSRIYRWVDEQGRTVYSDQPSGRGAVVQPLPQIGSVSVSADIQRRVDQQQVQTRQQAQQLISQSAQTGSTNGPPQYNFSNTSAGQKHGYVVISGRVSGGQVCNNLLVKAWAHSDRGRHISGRTDSVSLGDFGSRLFEIKVDSRWNGTGRRPEWDITRLEAYCSL
ncbi:DUF4124 domain-containing protein [Pelovirga terrestris]|uniref:DUF4124 domain-containing protein n=1 Tax=Pelovirga terrestris TaxID=2771352 RepID=A0A8J6QZ65_9BACT|nr:DUF4124 domain-containing protein [Pelovirga terrestris]MBD1401883.1 DUF4124 domain-containing protein [Pelovirga terrestris]